MMEHGSREYDISDHLTVSCTCDTAVGSEGCEWLSTDEIDSICPSREEYPSSTWEIEGSWEARARRIEVCSAHTISIESCIDIEEDTITRSCHRYRGCWSIDYRSRALMEKYPKKYYTNRYNDKNESHHISMLAYFFAKSEFWYYFLLAYPSVRTSFWQVDIIPVL